MSAALAALLLALLARRGGADPKMCAVPSDRRRRLAVRQALNTVQRPEFGRFLARAASDRPLPEDARIRLAVASDRLLAATAVTEEAIHLWAGTDRWGARHIWLRHGPDSGSAPWETLRIDDWPFVQDMIDDPRSEIAARGPGRWAISSPVYRRRPRRIGYRLVIEETAGILVPHTFYRFDARR